MFIHGKCDCESYRGSTSQFWDLDTRETDELEMG
jgi:hypothetical protein